MTTFANTVLSVQTFDDEGLAIIGWCMGIQSDKLTVKDVNKFVRTCVEQEIERARERRKFEQEQEQSPAPVSAEDAPYKYYNLINPSDVYTLRAKEEKIAVLAAIVVGHGIYGLEDDDANNVSPIFLFGGIDEWYNKRFGGLIENAVKSHYAALADCFDSFAIVSKKARDAYYEMFDHLAPEEREPWREHFHDEHRSSMNDIGARAYKLAKRCRDKLAEQEKSGIEERVDRLLQK